MGGVVIPIFIPIIVNKNKYFFCEDLLPRTRYVRDRLP